jgi:hypothetical protein
MPKYSAVAWERAMKVQEVILRAMAKKITWWQAAEIVGLWFAKTLADCKINNIAATRPPLFCYNSRLCFDS